MTITEAAACGTPAVATRIAGHRTRSSTAHRVCSPTTSTALAGALDRVLGDATLRRVGSAEAALATPREFTWGATARGTLEVLAAEALRRRRQA